MHRGHRRSTRELLVSLRGGGKKGKKAKGKSESSSSSSSSSGEKQEEDDDVFDDDEDGDGDDDGDDGGEGGGGGNGLQMMASVQDMWTKTPPITQVYVGSSLALSMLVFAANKNVWPEFLNLSWKHVLMGQLWRPFTAFLFFGPLGLNYILTVHFVWTYMAQLEKLNYKAPEDFFVLIAFGATALLALYSVLGLSTKFLGHNLSTYLVYIWARLFEGTDVNVMDLFLLKAEVLPWFFCAQTFILEGEVPFADLLGIVVGHLYHVLSKRKMLVAPAPIKAWFSSERMTQRYNKFKGDFEVM
jgi:Derlin-2/3